MTSEYQLDVGSAVKVNIPKCLIAAHQTEVRSGVANKAIHIIVFDHVDVRKNHEEIDGVRYPRDSVYINCGINDYLDKYRDLNLFYEQYAK